MPSNLFALKPVLAVVLIVCAINILSSTVARWAAGADTETLVSAAVALAAGSRGGMSESQEATVASMMRPMIRYYPVTESASVLLGLLVLSTVFFAALALVDAGLKWPVVFGASAYAALAMAVGRLAITAGLSALKPPTVDQLVDGSFLSTNPAGVLPESAGPVLLAAARSLDALTIVYLMVFVAMLGSYGNGRVSEKTIGVVVSVCFVILLTIRMGWAAAFGA